MGESSGDDTIHTLRVLVATDCHLGYMEKDDIRRFDSFRAFEEICSLAEQREVDLLLLGGDLFHENKPSRSTLVKAIEILRRYCLNDRPVQFQVVSDQTINFLNIFGHVNYEDPHFNVGLPVFSIHGNHDDPAGVDNLSAVDILSACNLVNYFGKMVLGGSGVGQITISPILIRKGNTSVALYGLGNIRDERLNRMFQTPHAVQWIRPESQEGCQVSDWFNILVLHQNRVKSNPKNAINEHFLPRFLDFIVWGHEHECLVDPVEVPGMGFHISQPGSSVATSLIDGEAKPKHVLLLEIKGTQYRSTKIPLKCVRPFEYAEGTQYRSTKIPLKCVRPFEYAEVVLKDVSDIDPNDQASVLEHLDKVVRDLIDRSSQRIVSRLELKLPLIRIKVDYSGFMTINPQRFGQKYVGKVANPQDILIFSKSAKKRQPYDENFEAERLRPEELNQQNIEALLSESNLKTEILPVNDLTIALHDFVNKDDKLAFYSCLQYNLDETRNKLNKEADGFKMREDDLILKVEQCMQERSKENRSYSKETLQSVFNSDSVQNKGKSLTGHEHSNDFDEEEDTRQILSTSKSTSRGRKRAAPETSRQLDYEPSKGRASKRGRGRGSSQLKQTTLDLAMGVRHSQRSSLASQVANDNEVESLSSEESDKYGLDEAVDTSEPEGKKSTRGRKRTASRGRGRGLASSAKLAKNTSSSVIQSMLMSRDDDDDMPKRVQPRPTRNYGAVIRK